MQLIDTHSHFDDSRLDSERDQSYLQARQQGVFQQIVPATTAHTWARVKAICNSYPGCYPAYGLHPYFLHTHQQEHIEELRAWLSKETAVAVGECGLDFLRPGLDELSQLFYFREQLKIADEFSLPVIMHANRATESVLQELKRSKVRKGVIHSYNGSLQQASKLLDLGFHLSFGGAITYTRAKRIRRLVASLPLECLMIETDAPDQPPHTHSGELNQPAYLMEVFSALCSLRPEKPQVIADTLNANARALFALPKPPETA